MQTWPQEDEREKVGAEENSENMHLDIKQYIIWLLGKEFDDILSLRVVWLDRFIEFNELANSALSSILIEKYNLNLKEEQFRDSFCTSNISTFNWTDQERDQLMDLIERKKSLYQEILADCIRRGNFGFPAEDLSDILNLIGSWVFEWKDSLYREYKKAALKYSATDLQNEIHYWIPDWDAVISYKESLLSSKVILKNIMSINDDNMRSYLLDATTLSLKWSHIYKDWIDAEQSELHSWHSDWKLVFLAPMENYIHRNFVDVEFIVLLREKISIDLSSFSELSAKYYNDPYWMDKIKSFYVEEILKWWGASYGQFLGKSFPNDMELRQRFGTFIWIVKWEFPKTFDEYRLKIAKVFSIDPDLLLEKKPEIVEWTQIETTYHEYGHSAFWVKSSKLEETKASLFYWLHLYDKYIESDQELTMWEISRLMYSFTLDFTRYISRMKDSQFRKYVYTSQILMHHMCDCWLLSYDSERNCLNLNLDWDDVIIRFKTLLRNLVWVLDTIKSIYESDDNAREGKMLEYYDNETLSVVNELHKNF